MSDSSLCESPLSYRCSYGSTSWITYGAWLQTHQQYKCHICLNLVVLISSLMVKMIYLHHWVPQYEFSSSMVFRNQSRLFRQLLRYDLSKTIASVGLILWHPLSLKKGIPSKSSEHSILPVQHHYWKRQNHTRFFLNVTRTWLFQSGLDTEGRNLGSAHQRLAYDLGRELTILN